MEKIKELLKDPKMDNESIYNLLYDLHFFAGLAEAEDDIRNGRFITLEEFDKEMEELYAKTFFNLNSKDF